jgi:hypothetical protein
MLVALLPSQASDYWIILRDHINDSLPPIADWGPYDMNQILYSLMIGNMQCWLDMNKEQILNGFVITTIMSDISGVRTLLLYNVVVLNKDAKTDFNSCYETLRLFALSKGCSKIGAFVMNEKVLALLQEHDVETRFVFAHKNL